MGKAFLHQRKLTIYILALISVLAYAPKILFYSYSIDTEFYVRTGEPFDWWISLGRYGLAYLTKLFTWGVNPDITLMNILTYLFLFMSAVLLLFLIWRTNSGIKSWWLLIGGGLYITSPVMLEQTNFVIQSTQVTIAFCLLNIAVLSIQYFNETRLFGFLGIAQVLTIVSLSIYTSFQAAFVVVTLLALYMSYHTETFSTYIKRAIPYVSILFIAMAFNAIITRILLVLLKIPQTGYLNNMYVIGKIPLKAWATQVSKVIYHEFLHPNYFLFIVPVILSLLVILIGIITIRKRGVQHFLIILTTVLLADMALGLPTLLMGQLGPIRSYAPTQSLTLLLLVIMLSNTLTARSLKIISLVLLTIALGCQIKITSDFGISEYNQFRAELNFKQELQNRVDALNLSNQDGYKLAFYGAKDFNSFGIIKGDALGKSFFEWGAGTNIGVNDRVGCFLNNEGWPISVVQSPEYLHLAKFAKNMPTFPNKGGLRVKGHYILIKLSN